MGLFVKLIEMECSNCGGKLKKVDKKLYKCPYCEATFLVAEVKRQKKAAKKEQKKIAKEQAKTQVKTQKKNERTRERQQTKKQSGWIPTILVYLAIISLMVFLFIKTDEENTADNTQTVSVQEEESVVFKQFAEWIFEKDYEKITEEEFASVTEVSLMGYDGFLSVDCVVAGKMVSFGFNGYRRNIMDGMEKFNNLNVLAVSASVERKDLKGLDNLTHLTCLNCIDELANIIPHPEKITHLSNVLYDETTEGLDAFTNLKSLNIRYVTLSDISGLGKLKNLEEISIDAYDKVKNFAVFGEMKNLKSIHIEAENLNSLEFVKGLENLESLGIVGSKLTSLEPIKGRTSLKKLNLENSLYITDFDVINTLTGLEQLSIYAGNLENEIQWSKLNNLKNIKIKSYGGSNFMQELPDMQQVEVLYLDGCRDISGIGSLANLKSLTIDGAGSVELNGLRDLTSLELLNIYDVDAARTGEAVFNLPNIKTINISNSSVSMNTGKLEKSETLKNLSIIYSGINSSPVSYSGFNKVYDLNNSISFVENFPALSTLTVCGGELDNIKFVENLVMLEKLNVTDNYISDVSPVENCPLLRELICRDNALIEMPEFERNIGVDMRSE